MKWHLPPNEGHYMLPSINSTMTMTITTYLEGHVFGDLLEGDMPVQLWKGLLMPSFGGSCDMVEINGC